MRSTQRSKTKLVLIRSPTHSGQGLCLSLLPGSFYLPHKFQGFISLNLIQANRPGFQSSQSIRGLIWSHKRDNTSFWESSCLMHSLIVRLLQRSLPIFCPNPGFECLQVMQLFFMCSPYIIVAPEKGITH